MVERRAVQTGEAEEKDGRTDQNAAEGDFRHGIKRRKRSFDVSKSWIDSQNVDGCEFDEGNDGSDGGDRGIGWRRQQIDESRRST